MRKYSSVKLGKEARDSIKEGMRAVYEPVSATIGASGRNAVYRQVVPVITNDGVSIARRINPKDKFERIGADLIKQSAEQTNLDAGDSTTTTVVLSYAIVEEGLKHIGDDGVNAMQVKKELEIAGKEVVELIKSNSKKIKSDKDLLDVAKISVENDAVAEVVANAVSKAGEYGTIIVEEGEGYEIEQNEVRGYYWDRGYISPYFMTNEKTESVLEDVAVIITDRYMNRYLEIMGTLNELHTKGVKSVLVIVDRMEGELLQTLITNKLKKILNICVVTRPPADEELEDLASISGGTAIIKDKGIREIKPEHVGYVKKVIATQNRTIIVADESKGYKERVKQLQAEYKETENEEVKQRLARLTDGLIVLRVGAKTESERTYLKLKVDDAVNAVQSAKQEGVVEGGGVALYKISNQITNPILREALKAPYKAILRNAGIRADGNAYNVLTGEKVEDMFKAGIIDPTKAERCAVENSISLASTVLTLNSVIVEEEEQES
jgi:chaperonin GroEL